MHDQSRSIPMAQLWSVHGSRNISFERCGFQCIVQSELTMKTCPAPIFTAF